MIPLIFPSHQQAFFKENVSTIIRRIAVKFGADIQELQRTNPNDFLSLDFSSRATSQSDFPLIR